MKLFIMACLIVASVIMAFWLPTHAASACTSVKQYKEHVGAIGKEYNRPLLRSETSNDDVVIVWNYFKNESAGAVAWFRNGCMAHVSVATLGAITAVFGKPAIKHFNAERVDL